jgi:ketosteroid isomerase-like protein
LVVELLRKNEELRQAGQQSGLSEGSHPQNPTGNDTRSHSMAFSTPLDTVSHLMAARCGADVDAALGCYEVNALVVLEPGRVARGAAAIKAFTKATISLPITFGHREIVECDEIALHYAAWTIKAPEGSEVSGRTTDVLRRQPSGGWLLALDNPWGSSLLDQKEFSGDSNAHD